MFEGLNSTYDRWKFLTHNRPISLHVQVNTDFWHFPRRGQFIEQILDYQQNVINVSLTLD